MGRKSLSGGPYSTKPFSTSSSMNKTPPSASSSTKDGTRRRIEQMEAQREQRRRAMKEMRVERAEEEQRNLARGNPGDVDFIGLVRKWREEHEGIAMSHGEGGEVVEDKICVTVRKRPLNNKEKKKKDHDAVTCLNPTITVHCPKLKVDGISKYLDHNSFRFDHCFDENCSTEEVYQFTAKPLVGYVCGGNGVRATVFAYGQTGSGKSHTMSGIERLVAEDIFLTLSNNSKSNGGCVLDETSCSVAIFEIYSGQILDLLNKRNKLKVLEDGKGEVVVSGLEEFAAATPSDFLSLIETAQSNRTTHATQANDTSSRSHAICQILLRDNRTNRLKGKLSLVDLAGSERGADTKSNNKSRRTETSEINTSLLALKECIRAIDSESKHVPYRQSKLTLILKDCFTSKLARTAMIATCSPGSSSTDHTVNTLRYADRIKEKVVGELMTRKSPVCAKTPLTQLAKPQTQTKQFAGKSDESGDGSDSGDAYANTSFENDDKTAHCGDDDEGEDYEEEEEIISESKQLSAFDKAVMDLIDEEEHLLNSHMTAIQEKAELLTEESQLLNSIQGDDLDMDEYASRLEDILDRKTELVQSLQENLGSFRDQLKRKEEISETIGMSSTIAA